jgi:hypothetical protein
MKKMYKKTLCHPKITNIVNNVKTHYYLYLYKNNLDIVLFSKKFWSSCIIISKDKKYLDENPELEYDFVVYSDISKIENVLKNPINKIIYCKNETQNFENAILEYEKCDFNFASVSVFVYKHNKNYELYLFSNEENFFIVKNKLNKKTICYLLMKQHEQIFDELTIKYTLNIINENMDIVMLNETEELVFYKNSYEIKPFQNVSSDIHHNLPGEENEEKNDWEYDCGFHDCDMDMIFDS